MATCIIFHIRTDEPSAIEKHLTAMLTDWSWSISLYSTSAQIVHDDHTVVDSHEPNWHSWYSYIPLSESYGSELGPNFIKALAALNGVKDAIAAVLTSDSTTGEAGEGLTGQALMIFENGLIVQNETSTQASTMDKDSEEQVHPDLYVHTTEQFYPLKNKERTMQDIMYRILNRFGLTTIRNAELQSHNAVKVAVESALSDKPYNTVSHFARVCSKYSFKVVAVGSSEAEMVDNAKQLAAREFGSDSEEQHIFAEKFLPHTKVMTEATSDLLH